jgi:hypothetical protein
VRQAESPSDDAAVAEEVAHFVWTGTRGKVEVLWFSAKHQVANTAANEIGRVTVSVEAANHLRRILVDQPTRNRVGINDRLGRLVVEGAFSCVVSPTEVRIYNSAHRFPMPVSGKKQ